MTRSLLFLLFFIFIVRLNAQVFTYSPSPIEYNVTPNSGENILNVTFTKPVDSVYNIFWKVEKNSTTFETPWTLAICDSNLCYLPTQNACPPGNPNILTGNTITIQFHFDPHGATGHSVVGFKFYGDKNYVNEVMATSIDITVGTSATKDFGANNIKVYPNPASDYFQLANSTNIKKVIVYNMFGREVKSFFHYNNAQHEIADLKSGMYVVKLLDDKNKIVKTLKFNKVYDGV